MNEPRQAQPDDLRRAFENAWKDDDPDVVRFGLTYDLDGAEWTSYGVDVPVRFSTTDRFHSLELNQALGRLQLVVQEETGWDDDEIELILELMPESKSA